MNKLGVWAFALILALAIGRPLSARGIVWDFLGDTHIDGIRDHDRIQISRRDGPFCTLQLRVSGDAIFFQRFIAHYSNGTSEELAITDRTSPEAKTLVMNLTGERRILESVEVWYFKKPWEHHPKITLYGSR